MPLDQSFVGRSYPPSDVYEVGLEKIREFATAVGATHPVYHDRDAARAAGYPDVIAPPTFPVVLWARFAAVVTDDPALGVDYSRVVHGDQRFGYTRPVHAGDRLVCVTTIEAITTRAGHDFLTTRTDMSTEDGEPVVSTWSRLVVRGKD
ncbi:MAG TPA: MaoC family dehydratase N-terminal domain-containing protein [Micromonosporaceae bacterium]